MNLWAHASLPLPKRHIDRLSHFAWHHPRNRKYITYRNVAIEGPSHKDNQHAQKSVEVRPCGCRDMRAYTRRHRQTHSLQNFAPLSGVNTFKHWLKTCHQIVINTVRQCGCAFDIMHRQNAWLANLGLFISATYSLFCLTVLHSLHFVSSGRRSINLLVVISRWFRLQTPALSQILRKVDAHDLECTPAASLKVVLFDSR